jgi:hypothetical protein
MTPVPAVQGKNIKCATGAKMWYICIMRKLLPVLFIFPLVFASCFLFDFDDVVDIHLDGNFWAINNKTGHSYRITADWIASGQYCNVWVERGSGVSVSMAQDFASQCDQIYQEMITAFSPRNFYYGGWWYDNLLQLADIFGNADGKITVLLLDIKDNYVKGVNDSYVAGYFYHMDLFDFYGSNNRDMIYIDTYPGLERITDAYRTLAHETQHLMNYTASHAFRGGNTMDLWVDEGLSSAAEWLYNSKFGVTPVHPEERWKWYSLNGNGKIKSLIDRGNNFYVWSNRRDESVYADLDDYATVYLFFQWLRLHASNGEEIYKDIISSGNVGYTAVTGAVASKIDSAYSNWNTLLSTWLAANSIKSDIYGYDSFLNTNLTKHNAPANTSINLYPGEGVYSPVTSDPGFSEHGNIKYAYLAGGTLNHTYQSGVLLTYNVNTSISGLRETGSTTGAANVMPAPSGARSAGGSAALSGPFPIGMQDRLRQLTPDTVIYDE